MLRYICSLLLLSLYGNNFGQLYTEYTSTADINSLVNNVFGSPNVQIFNIQYKADTVHFNANYTRINDIGYFNSSSSTVGFEKGLILTGGELASPYGLGVPAINTGTYWKTTPGDSILNLITAPSQTLGAAILEFDFIPNGDSIKFNYVFASDEYPSQICDDDYDVFAFHISGPGIVGSKNIALIPGTNFPVGNNTINDTSLTIYADQLDLSMCPTVDYPHLYVDHSGDTTFIFNGSTTVLVATSETIPCETYHLRLAVAESNLRGEYSAVFLEANSFNSESISVESEISYGNGDSLLYEGCGYANIIIKRTYNIQEPKTYNITTSGSAVNGIDYEIQPLQITMPSGVDSDTIKVIPLNDNITDYGENLILTVGDTLCNGNYFESMVELIIFEKEDYQIQILPETNVFCEETTFTSIVVGAIPPVNYNWNNGVSLDSNLVYYPNFNQSHLVQWIILNSSDACGNFASDSSYVIFSHNPIANFVISPNYIDLLDPLVDFYDNSSNDATVWSWSFENGFISNTQNPKYLYSDTGHYNVMLCVKNQFECADSITKTITINEIPTLYIPNSFTPNGDGLNDNFQIIGNGIISFNIEIYNRWGELVFFSTEIDNKWSGENCSEGVYSYKVFLEFHNKIFKEYNGTIYLIR